MCSLLEMCILKDFQKDSGLGKIISKKIIKSSAEQITDTLVNKI